MGFARLYGGSVAGGGVGNPRLVRHEVGPSYHYYCTTSQ